MAANLAVASTSAIELAAANDLLAAGPGDSLFTAVVGVDASAPSVLRPPQPEVASVDQGYAVAWTRLAAALRNGAKVSLARYWLMIENCLVPFSAATAAAAVAHPVSVADVACAVLLDTNTGTITCAASDAVPVPAAVSDLFARRHHAETSDAAGTASLTPVWTIGHAAVEALKSAPGSVSHGDWIGAPEVQALCAALGVAAGYAEGRRAQLAHALKRCLQLQRRHAADPALARDRADVRRAFGHYAHRGVAFVDVTPCLEDHGEAVARRAAAAVAPRIALLRALDVCGAVPRRLAVAGIASRGYLFAPYVARGLAAALGVSVAVLVVMKGGALPATAVASEPISAKEYAADTAGVECLVTRRCDRSGWCVAMQERRKAAAACSRGNPFASSPRASATPRARACSSQGHCHL